MLTADLVEVRRRGTDLSLRPLTAEERERGLALAETYVGLLEAHVGRERAELLEACRAVPFAARERRLAAGLCKLALDGCSFEAAATTAPDELRADLFLRAATYRRQLAPGAVFDRAAVVSEVSSRRGMTEEEVERSLYADLPEAHRLMKVELAGPRALLATYEAAGVQAVLLRAVKVTARVSGASPAAYRQLFRKLKFLRLLHSIEPLPPDKKTKQPPGYVLHIDGPFSLFEGVTKYGLQLALAYPALAACGRLLLEADVRWGKDRRPLRFVARSNGEVGDQAGPALAPEVQTLLDGLAADDTWQARASERLVDLPGAGLLVPDLELVHRGTGRLVLVEVLGFWSREAVWKRIELAAQGLPHPMIFAVSKHLRVSEEALPEELPAALMVYAHAISGGAVLKKAAALVKSRRPVPGD